MSDLDPRTPVLVGAAALRQREDDPTRSLDAEEVLSPAGDILHPVEIERELAWPVRQYAVIEAALGAADQMGAADQRDLVDAMWARITSVSADNPWAWSPGLVTPDDLAPSATNPMLAAPYTRRHVSSWNVDQAAALLLCSAGTAVAEVTAVTATRPVDPAAEGPATVVGATLVHERGLPSQAVAVVETDAGVRMVATTDGPAGLHVGDRITLAEGRARI